MDVLSAVLGLCQLFVIVFVSYTAGFDGWSRRNVWLWVAGLLAFSVVAEIVSKLEYGFIEPMTIAIRFTFLVIVFHTPMYFLGRRHARLRNIT